MSEALARRLVAALGDAALRLGRDGARGGIELGWSLGFGGFLERFGARERVDGRRTIVALRNQVLYEGARAVHDVLATAGVDHFFVKGVTLLHQIYEPGDRDMADVDVYVDPEAREQAVDALRAVGFAELGEQGGPQAMRCGIAMIREAAGIDLESVDLDVHWRLEPVERLLPRGDLRVPDRVWANVDTTGELPVPAPEHHAAMLVHHLVHHDLLHVRSAVDLALLVEAMEPSAGVEWERMAELLGVLRATRMLAAGFLSVLGVAVPKGIGAAPRDTRAAAVAARVRPDHWFEWVSRASDVEFAMITRSRIQRRRQLLDGEWTGWKLLIDAIAPPDEYLRWRWPGAGTRLGRWRAHVRQVLRKVRA